MNRVLVITSILPVSEIHYKKTENDIILITEERITERYSNIVFNYIFIFPYANRLLSKFSDKWKSYFLLKRNKNIYLSGKLIFPLPIFSIRRRTILRKYFIYFGLLLNQKRLDKFIQEFKPTILHAQDANTSAYIAKYIKKRYGIPYVVTIRGVNRYVDTMIKNNLKEARYLIALSLVQQKKLKLLTDRISVLLIHGIDDFFFQNRNRELLPSKSSLKLLMIGRLIKLKNIATVIEVIRWFDQISFDIIGEGPEEAKLQEQVAQYGLEGRVNFLGKMSQDCISRRLADYDLFVMLSYPETLGRVYFEVMASGLPVVASKNTGIDGIITDRVEGFLINHCSSEELRQVFIEIFERPTILKQMGEKAHKLMENYRWVKVARMYYEMYNLDVE